MDAEDGRPKRDAMLDDTERDSQRRRVDADMVLAVTCDEEALGRNHIASTSLSDHRNALF